MEPTDIYLRVQLPRGCFNALDTLLILLSPLETLPVTIMSPHTSSLGSVHVLMSTVACTAVLVGARLYRRPEVLSGQSGACAQLLAER